MVSEIVRSFSSTEEYIKEMQKATIDEVYREAVDQAIEKEVTHEMLNEAFTKLADAEAELNILEDLFVAGKVDKKEITSAKRRFTRAKSQLDNMIKEFDS